MNTIIKHLQSHKGVCDYKINLDRKESYELFFVKGSLETVRNTDNTDKEVTVYVDHGSHFLLPVRIFLSQGISPNWNR